LDILLYIVSLVVLYIIIETAVKNGINKSDLVQKSNKDNHRPFIKKDLDD